MITYVRFLGIKHDTDNTWYRVEKISEKYKKIKETHIYKERKFPVMQFYSSGGFHPNLKIAVLRSKKEQKSKDFKNEIFTPNKEKSVANMEDFLFGD